MSRLPTPGSDAGNWGSILNDYLSVEHDADGHTTYTPTGSSTTKTVASKLNERISVKDFGAIGDGQSHPLSGIYSTLIQAQAVHPTAATLSDELDGVATQTAINYLRDHGGGTLYCPRGTYICNTEITLPKSIIFDATVANQVNWHGEGYATNYKWNTDLGTGKWAVRPADGALGGTGYKGNGEISGVRFTGPNETFSYNVAPCNMKGVFPGAERKLINCTIAYFYAGISIAGDHSMLYNVYCHKNYYGAYWEQPYSNLFGGYLFEGVYMSGAKAAIGIDYRAQPQGTFIKCYFGGSPYGFFKECNGVTTYNGTLKGFCNSIFTECSFEYTGNAMISDESEANGGDPVTYWYEVRFDLPLFTWDVTRNISSLAKNAVIGLGKAERFEILGFKENFGWTPGSLGIFNIMHPTGMFIRGHIINLVSNAVTGGTHVFSNKSDIGIGRVAFHHTGPTWDGWGRARRCSTSQTWIAGDILADTSGATVIVAPAATGLYSNGFAGIALEANDGTANNVVLVVEEGSGIPVNADIATLSYAGLAYYARLSPTVKGKACLAVNVSDGPVLGYVQSSVNGTGGNNAIMYINLYNPPLVNNPQALSIRSEAGTAVTISNLTSRESYVRFTAAGAVTYTIPVSTTTPLPIGCSIKIFAAGAGGVTVSPASGVTLNGTATITQNTSRMLVQVSTDVWDVY